MVINRGNYYRAVTLVNMILPKKIYEQTNYKIFYDCECRQDLLNKKVKDISSTASPVQGRALKYTQIIAGFINYSSFLCGCQ